MKLYLVQHGAALAKEADPDRPLSERGRADIGQLAQWLSRRGVEVGEIRHSGKTRARQTAELLAGLTGEGRVREHAGLAPDDPAQAFCAALESGDTDLLVVSHMPFVGRAVAVLLGADPARPVVEFVPGSLACLERDEPPGPWRIQLFLQPVAL